MANKIKFKRGERASLPLLDTGEPGLCTDTAQVFIGNGSGNIELAKQSSLDALSATMTGQAPLFEKATGTATAITLTLQTLQDGYTKSFIATTNNGAVATTINSVPLYKPNTTTAPNLVAGKAYTIWYDESKTCFFIKASAEGTATTSSVLAGYTFSNDSDTGLTGTIASLGATSYTPGTTNKTIAAGKYISGTQTILGDANLITANIKSGISIFGVTGSTSVVDTSDATAVASGILASQTAYVNGSKITGTIASKAAATITPGTTNQTMGAGQYLSGTQTILGDADLVSANIKSGITIFGVAGNTSVIDTSGGTVTSNAQLLSGYKAYSNGTLYTGTIASKAAATYTPSTANQTIASGQYLSGVQTIVGDADLIAANIKSGASIFGVSGTFTSDATATASDILSGKTAYVNGAKITGIGASNSANHIYMKVSSTSKSFSVGFSPSVVQIIYKDDTYQYVVYRIITSPYFSSFGGGYALGGHYKLRLSDGLTMSSDSALTISDNGSSYYSFTDSIPSSCSTYEVWAWD
jgi:hypothetical protein